MFVFSLQARRKYCDCAHFPAVFHRESWKQLNMCFQMLLPQYHSFGVQKNNIKGLIFRLSFTLINNKQINPLRKQQFLTHSLHDTNLGLPVRHLEFEKEAAAYHPYSRLKRLSRPSCTCFTHVLAPSAERLSSETQRQLIDAIFSGQSLHQEVKFRRKISRRPKISRHVD